MPAAVETNPAPVPVWVFRPLPANAQIDAALLRKVAAAMNGKDGRPDLYGLGMMLDDAKPYAEYDAAANRAAALVWPHVGRLLSDPDATVRRQLLRFAVGHLPPRAAARILRRLARDPDRKVRRAVAALIEERPPREVALPADRTPEAPWDATGWTPAPGSREPARHPGGARVQQARGVPPLATVGDLRTLLGIRSTRQLGYFLLATDADGGPYTAFTVAKNGAAGAAGAVRIIHAPRGGLMWVQRRLLDLILAKVAVHQAAHGFVPGRSTVTNAAAHVGAGLLLKFDLCDFFPTIHHFRVVGMFASLGYACADGRFSSDDQSRAVAPTLARLCTHTPDPARTAAGLLPQGAPTSPAISNLVCRRMDARLAGLAARAGGVYTRYADDLTFSFRGPAAEKVPVGRFRWWVDQVCHQEGFLINHAKFRVVRAAERQVVTGLVVNDRVGVRRADRHRFRAILHACERHGVDSQARGRERFRDWLRGFAAYIHMVHPDEGRDLLDRVDRLLGGPPPQEDDGGRPPGGDAPPPAPPFDPEAGPP